MARAWLGLAALAVALPALLGGAGQPRSKYAVGQVWEYRTRPEDTGSLLRIQAVENLPEFAREGPVYHISIIGLRLSGPDYGVKTVQHAPVTRQTLDASVVRIARTKAVFPDATAGITAWRVARGGVYTIPVAEIVATMEQVLSSRNVVQA